MCTPTQCRYLSQATHLLVSITRNGTIRAADPRNAKPLGYEASDLPGQPLADLVAADDRQRLSRTLERCGTGQAVWEELTFVTAGGRSVPMLCCLQRLSRSRNRAAFLVTGFRLELFRGESQMEAAAALGQLAFRCHRPAHRLMQAVEALQAQYPSCEATERCRADLDGLLEAVSESISRPQHPEPGQPVDVVRVLEGALRLIDADPAYKGLRVTLRPERSCIWANVHPAGLVFVALHLAANARDATVGAKSPRLFVDACLGEDHVAIEFQDNGHGLAREDLDCVFAPFFRRSGAKGDCAGLGLTTCREMIQFMGGRIRILSRPSKGTTVIITLPAAPPPA